MVPINNNGSSACASAGWVISGLERLQKDNSFPGICYYQVFTVVTVRAVESDHVTRLYSFSMGNLHSRVKNLGL